MTKSELIEVVAQEANLTKGRAELVINTITHGTILKTDDTIVVHCSLRTADGTKRLQVVWNEPIARDRHFLDERMTAPKSRFGRAILEPSVAAAIGGALGLFFAQPGGIFAPIGGAIAGLLLAAIRLRYEYREK